MEKLKTIPNSATRTKKRFFGIVAVAIVLIAALGAGYYFRFKSNQAHFKKYGLEILDSYYYRIGRQLNNEILAKLSDYPSKSSTTVKKKDSLCKMQIDSVDKQIYDTVCQSKIEIIDLAIDNLYKEIQLENGFLEKPFSEFIITTISKSNDSLNPESIKTKNSLFIGDDFNYDTLLAKDSLNNGLVKNYEASGANYLLFGRKYQFEYDPDDTYTCEIVLIGLVDGKSFNKATRELDPWVIALLLTFLLISLFGLPFFKMIFIASDERVFSRDVIAAGFAMVVGASLVIVIFISLMEYGYKYNVTLPNDLEQMGKTISERFVRENRANVEELHNFQLDKYATGRFDSIKCEDSRLMQHFKFIITIDDSGDIKQRINLIKEPPKFPVNIKDREYVEDFRKKRNIWRTAVGEEDSVKTKEIAYVMRPVVAMESGEEEAVYMIEDKNSDHSDFSDKSHKPDACCYRIASAQLSSIHLPVMPFGFQYAIIDDSKNSDVWFHSQPGKSTLEEFFKVSRNANDLRAAIYARVEAGGRLNYHGSKFIYFITPIQGTNLNTIVLYDLALLRLQTSEVLSITGIAISISFMAIGLIFILTLLLKGRKTQLYKEEKFIFDFLTPKDVHKNRYLFLSVSFTVILILGAVFGFTQKFPPVSAFIIGFLAIIWCYIMVYYVLYPYNRKNFKFYVNNILFLIAIVALNIILWNEGSGTVWKFGSSLVLQFLCLLCIALSQLVFGYEKSMPLSDSGTVPRPLQNKRFEDYARGVRFWFEKFPLSLSHRYSLFLFSWLLAAALLPAIVFYAKAEKINELIWVKTDQIYMSRAYLNKERKLKEIIPPINADYFGMEYSQVYQKHLDSGKYIDKRYSLTDRRPVNGKTDTPDHVNLFRKLLWSTRPIFNEKIRNYKGMVYQTASDSSWSSREDIKEIQLATLNSNTKNKEVFSVWEGIQSPPESRKNVHYYLLLVRFFGIVVLLGILYSIILFYTNRFYGFRFRHLKPINFDTDKKANYAREFGEMLSFKTSNSGLLLIGLPFSGKRSFAEKIIRACDEMVDARDASGKTHVTNTTQRTAHVSFLKLDDTQKDEGIEGILNSLSGSPLFEGGKTNWDTRQWESTDYFIVENLEHGLKSFKLNKIKLKVISHLIAHKKRLVITSEVYPNQVFAIYKSLLERETDQDENSLISDYNSWRNIFGSFPQILVGMTDQKRQVIDLLDTMGRRKEIVKEIADEVGYSQFLPRLAPVMMAKYQDATFDGQSMILHVQKLSHGYYTDIWNGLPARERYMLYDLAKDGFMNIKNGNSLFSLMKKGLIVWRDRPSIFNESFQNFIISFVSKKEALQLERRNRQDSSWGTIKIVMYLMILTLIVFILLGEPGLLEDFEELLAAVGGLGVILPIISTVLGKSGEK